MKKSLLVALALSFVAFVGCTKTPAPETTEAVTTEAPAADAPVAEEAPAATEEAPAADAPAAN